MDATLPDRAAGTAAAPPVRQTFVPLTNQVGAWPAGRIVALPAGQIAALLAGRVATLLAAAALGACGGGGGTDAASPPAAADPVAVAEVRAVRDYMLDWYFWRDRIAPADLTGVATAEAALEALRARPIDRYSFIEPRAAAEAFYDESRTVGLGVGYATLAEGAVELRFVQPASPAAAAGLLRGDRIVAIDGRAVADLTDAGALSDAFGPPQAGLTVTLRIDRGAGAFDVAVTKAAYPFASVQAARVLAGGARRVGYVYLASFTEPTRADWAAALQTLVAGGAQDLLVDLRDNGGGRLAVAAAVAATLAPADAAGAPFWRVRFNDRHTDADYTVTLPASTAPTAPAASTASAPRFARVVMLTSATTCSAAELLQFGLRPYVPVESVGLPTCGKPVGFVPQPIGADRLLNAVTFGGASREAPAEYYDGLAPRCTAADDRRHPLGDAADPLVATALAWLRDGVCPAARAAATGAKSTTAATTGAGPAPPIRRDDARPYRGPLDWAGVR